MLAAVSRPVAAFLLTVAILALACSTGGPAADRSVAGGSGGGDAGGSGGEGGLALGGSGGDAVPACALDFAEPERPWVATDPRPWEELRSSDLVIAHVQPAEGANAGETGRTYWLTADETPCFRVLLALGPSFTEGRTITAIATIDGLQVRFGEREQARGLEIWTPPGGYGDEQQICVDVTEVEDGRHLLALHFRIDGQTFPFGSEPVVPIVLHKNSRCLPELAWRWAPVRDRGPTEGQLLENRETGAPLLPSASDSPYVDGVLPVRMSLLRTVRWATGDLVLYALLDGEQIPLGHLGLRPHYDLPFTDVISEVEFDFTDLPDDGERHTLSIHQLWNFSEPLEDDAGRATSFPPFHQLHTVVWIRASR